MLNQNKEEEHESAYTDVRSTHAPYSWVKNLNYLDLKYMRHISIRNYENKLGKF